MKKASTRDRGFIHLLTRQMGVVRTTLTGLTGGHELYEVERSHLDSRVLGFLLHEARSLDKSRVQTELPQFWSSIEGLFCLGKKSVIDWPGLPGV